MAKRCILAITLLLAAVPAAFGLDLGLGIEGAYSLGLLGEEITGVPINITFNHLLAGVYFDVEYLRLSASFVGNAGEIIIDSSMPVVGTSGFRFYHLKFTALAKLPLTIRSFKLWTGVGASYLLCLLLDNNGDGIDDRTPETMMDDFYLVLAVGGEFRLWNFLTIGPCFSLNYDLTPSVSSTAPPDSQFTWIHLTFSIAIGITFPI